MFPQPPGVFTNPPMNPAPQQPPPRPSFQGWFHTPPDPGHDTDERQNFFGGANQEEKNFAGTKEDFQYYSALPYEARMEHCRQENWNDNMDVPNQNPMDTGRSGGMGEKQSPYYQCIDYGHGKSNPAMYDNPADRVSPEKSDFRPPGESFSMENYEIRDEELLQLFEDGLNLMIRSNNGIQVMLESNSRLRWFLLPIFKDLNHDTVTQVFGQGDENVAAKKLEKLVCLSKNKIQELCSEIAETISIRQNEEANQGIAKPDQVLNDYENPMSHEKDGPSDFDQLPMTAVSDNPGRETSIPQSMPQHKDGFDPTLFPHNSSVDVGEMIRPNFNNFPFPLRPPPPFSTGPDPSPHLMLPSPRFPHFMLQPPNPAVPVLRNTMLPLPQVASIVANSMFLRQKFPPPISTMGPLLVRPSTGDSKTYPPKITPIPAPNKKLKKVKQPSCLRTIPLLSETMTKCLDSAKKNSNVKISTPNETKPLVIKNKTPDKTENMTPKEKLVYLIKSLKSLKTPVCKISFFDSLPQRIACPTLKLQYQVVEQDKLFFGTFSVDGVFITRQKAENKKKLKKIVFERAYDVFQSCSADVIINNGNPNADDEKILKEEKFKLIEHITKIQKLFTTCNSKENITLQQINKSLVKKLPFIFVNKKVGKPNTCNHIMMKIMLGDCRIAVALASTAKAANEKVSALAIQRMKTLSAKEIAYEKGLEKLDEATIEKKSVEKNNFALKQKFQRLKDLMKKQKPFPAKIMKQDFLNKIAAAIGIPHSLVYQKVSKNGMKVICNLFLGKICVAYAWGASAMIARSDVYDEAWKLLLLKPFTFFISRTTHWNETSRYRTFSTIPHLLEKGGGGSDKKPLNAPSQTGEVKNLLKSASTPAKKQ